MQVSSLRSWIMAARPKTLTAALGPIIVATALVQAEGHTIHWWISLCAFVSTLFIQIGTNLFNDALDFEKGADTEHRIGPTRVTQSGRFSARAVKIGGLLCFVIAAALGVPLVLEAGWPIVVIGLLSLLCGYLYTGGPYPLAYKGLGDLFVFVFFGWVATMGLFYIHVGTVTFSSFLMGTQMGLFSVALIAINNLRDYKQDELVDKRTLAVRLGPGLAKLQIALCLISPFLINLIYYFKYRWLAAAMLPILAMRFAVGLAKEIYETEPSQTYNQFLARASFTQILFAVLLACGLFFA